MWLCRNYYFNEVCRCNVQEAYWVKNDICSRCHTRFKSIEDEDFVPKELEDEVQIMWSTKAPGMPMPRPFLPPMSRNAQWNTGYGNQGVVMQAQGEAQHASHANQRPVGQAPAHALGVAYGAPAARGTVMQAQGQDQAAENGAPDVTATNSQCTTQSGSAQVFSTVSAATEYNSQNLPGGGFYQDVLGNRAIDLKATPLATFEQCKIQEAKQTDFSGSRSSEDNDIVFGGERPIPYHLAKENNADEEGSGYDSDVRIKDTSKQTDTGSFKVQYHFAKDNHAGRYDVGYGTDAPSKRSSKKDEGNDGIGAPYPSTVDWIAAQFDRVYGNHATSKRDSKHDEGDGGSKVPYHLAEDSNAAQEDTSYGTNVPSNGSYKQDWDNGGVAVPYHFARDNIVARADGDYEAEVPSKRNSMRDKDNDGLNIPLHQGKNISGLGMGSSTRNPFDGDKRFKNPSIPSKQRDNGIKGAYGRVTKSTGARIMQASKRCLEKLDGASQESHRDGGW